MDPGEINTASLCRVDDRPSRENVNPKPPEQTPTDHCKTRATGLFRLPTLTRTLYFHFVPSSQSAQLKTHPHKMIDQEVS
jgi:hypothetical protein